MILSTLQWILLMTFIDGLLGLVGVFSFFVSKKYLNKIILILVAFAAGALLGGAFFHLIPESIEKLSLAITLILTIAGFCTFFLVEKLLHWHYCRNEGHCHDHEHPYVYLLLIGSSIHNFIDGLLIAGSFIISIPLGVVTSVLIIVHEIPHEIGNFGVLVHGGMKRGKAVLADFLIQLTAILGGLAGYFFLNLNKYVAILLPLAAGGFLYLVFFDLIPEVLEEKNKIKLIINIIAIILGLLLLLSAKYLAG
ncbi:Zinc transporter ZupT [uncultured archaeon]|nr:Zinc transporter ZupT [uncultured archaeon]